MKQLVPLTHLHNLIFFVYQRSKDQHYQIVHLLQNEFLFMLTIKTDHLLKLDSCQKQFHCSPAHRYRLRLYYCFVHIH